MFHYCRANWAALAKQGVRSIEDFSKTYVEVFEKSAGSEYSIFARDGTNIVGVQFAYPTTVDAYSNCNAQRHIPQLQKFMEKYFEQRTENLPDEEFIYVCYFGVPADYRNKGLGAKVTKRMVERVKQKKCWPVIFVECSNSYSEAVMAKQGFKVIGELRYETTETRMGS